MALRVFMFPLTDKLMICFAIITSNFLTLMLVVSIMYSLTFFSLFPNGFSLFDLIYKMFLRI